VRRVLLPRSILSGALSSRVVGVAALCLAVLAYFWQPACAQTEGYCTVTGVRSEQLSNAVRITIQADGTMRTSIRWLDFYAGRFRRAAFLERDIIPFQLTNARSAVGNFVDISTYPVSYLKLSTPPDSREGVGLECELHLYRPAVLGRIHTDNEELGGGGMFGDVQVDMESSQNGAEFYITVTSDKHVDLEDLAQAGKSESELPVRLTTDLSDDGLLSITALNADLEETVQQVAALIGTTVVIDDEVHRLLTCRLTELDFEQFLQVLARGYGLAVAQRDGTGYVRTALPSTVASYWAASATVIPLHHLSTSEVLSLLPDYVLRFVRPSKSANALVATGPAPLLDRLQADIAKLDQPAMQITVRAMLVEANSDADARRALALMTAGGTTEFALDPDASRIRFGVAQKRASEITASLKALQRQAAVQLRVHPHMTVLNGQEAEFFFGETQYFTFQTSGKAGELPESDLELMLEISAVCERLTGLTPMGGSDYRQPWRKPISLPGNSDEFGYYVLGIPWFTIELGNSYSSAGIAAKDYFAADSQTRARDYMRQVLKFVDDNPDHPWDWKPWSEFDHPQLGRVEIGGTGSGNDIMPHPRHIADLSVKTTDFILQHSDWHPQIALSALEAVQVSDEVYRIRGRVANVGMHSTNVMSTAAASRTHEPVCVALDLPEGVQIVSRPGTFEFDVLASRSFQAVEWFVTAPTGTQIAIQASHPRGGKAKAQLKLQ
jgi:hypothetical protein